MVRSVGVLGLAALAALAFARSSPDAKEGGPTSVAVGGNVVWVALGQGVVRRIDARTGKSVGHETRVGSYPNDITVTRTAVWVANYGSGGDVYAPPNGSLSRLDRRTGRVVETIALPRVSPTGLAATGGLLWVIGSSDRRLLAIDVRTNRLKLVRRLAGPLVPWAIAASSKRVVVSLAMDARSCARSVLCRSGRFRGKILAFDPRTGKRTRALTVGAGPNEIAVARGIVWITNPAEGTVNRFDPVRARFVGAPVRVGPRPLAIATGPEAVWVSAFDGEKSWLVSIDVKTAKSTQRRGQFGARAQIDDLAVSRERIWAVTSHGALISIRR